MASHDYPEIVVRNSGYVTLQKFRDERDGHLNILEAKRDVPFAIERVYYINHLEQCVSVRGKHAHRTLWQAIFCVSGSFRLRLDDSARQQDMLLWRDNVGVIIGPGLWHTMEDFTEGCVLLVVASAHFDESDYIRDYDEFLAWTRQTPQ